jgi:hypothetical protein
MSKPQPLPKPLSDDLAQLKTLIDGRITGRTETEVIVQQEKENLDEYARQLKKLQQHAAKILHIEDSLSAKLQAKDLKEGEIEG